MIRVESVAVTRYAGYPPLHKCLHCFNVTEGGDTASYLVRHAFCPRIPDHPTRKEPAMPNTQIDEGTRAALCAMWPPARPPVRNPELMTGMHAVCWSTSEAGALNLAEAAVRLGLATGNPAEGYRLTVDGVAALDG